MPEPFLIYPPLSYDDRQTVATTDTFPTVRDDGGELETGDCLESDTGDLYYWTGAAWRLVTPAQVTLLTLQVLIQIRDALADDPDEE